MPESEDKKPLKAVIGYFPIFAAIAFGYGIVNQYVYYYFFNINVLEYTELNELLLDTLNHLFIVFIPILIIIPIVAYFSIKILDRRDSELTIVERLETALQPVQKKVSKIYYYIATGLFILSEILTLISYLLTKTYDVPDELGVVTIYVFSLIYLLHLDFFNETYLKVFGKTLDSGLYLIIFSCIILMGIATYKGLKNASNTKNHNTQLMVIINNHDTIKSTKKYYYIGKTKGYFFFYNDSTKTTDARSIKEIQILNIK